MRSSYSTPSAFMRAIAADFGRVLLGHQHLPGILDHRLDDADHVDHVLRVVGVERRDHLDGERGERRRQAHRRSTSRPHARRPSATRCAPRDSARRRRGARSATPAASRLRYTAIARRWCQRRRSGGSWFSASSAFNATGPSGRPSTVATRSAVTLNRDVSGSGLAATSAIERRLVVVHEVVGRLGLDRLAARLGIVAGLGQRLGVLDDVIGRLGPHVPVGVEARAGRPGRRAGGTRGP